jgi:hypothetical protein
LRVRVKQENLIVPETRITTTALVEQGAIPREIELTCGAACVWCIVVWLDNREKILQYTSTSKHFADDDDHLTIY